MEEEKKVSVFEARAAVQFLYNDVETTEGFEAVELIERFLMQYKTIR